MRAAIENKRRDVEIVAINDLGPVETNAHLLQYDSVHGKLLEKVLVDGNGIQVGNSRIKVTAEKDPAKLPWGELGVDVALECTGIFASKDAASAHIEAGARRVLISAPAIGADITVVYGVNHSDLNAGHRVVSNASCTTNCLAPIAKVLHNNLFVERGVMTTIHSFTNDQQILDLPHKDLRRARAASVSMIPTTTGAAKAVCLVLPELKGKLDGMAIRVPTPNVSIVDFVADVSKGTTESEVNDMFKVASKGDLKGVLDYEEQPLVSVDFQGNSFSSIVDGLATKVIDKKLVKVLAWYDNEWGYSSRVCDLLKLIVKKGLKKL